jgi:hypothetical protein
VTLEIILRSFLSDKLRLVGLSQLDDTFVQKSAPHVRDRIGVSNTQNIGQKITQDNSQSDTQKRQISLRITRHNPFYDWSKGDALA